MTARKVKGLTLLARRADLVKVSHVLTPTQVAQLDALAKAAGLSRSDVLRQLLDRALEQAA